jgi:uncharacterized Zn finger protein (UPF0148 family)
MDQDRINRNVSELSQKLLEGCKLLSESCPETNVPLVLTLDGRMFSVGNDAYYEKDESGGLRRVGSAYLAPSAPFAPPGSGRRAHSPGPAAASDSSGGSLSAKVAEKLLEGYTLLNESCPATNAPLVESPDGRILSVGTGTWYERRGESIVPVQARAHPAPPTTLAGGGSPAPSAAASVYASSVRSSYPDSRTDGRATYTRPYPPAASESLPASLNSAVPSGHAAALPSAAAAAAAAIPLSPPPMGGALQTEIHAATEVLTEKLAQATGALGRASDIGTVAPLVAHIREIAAAIAALRAI